MQGEARHPPMASLNLSPRAVMPIMQVSPPISVQILELEPTPHSSAPFLRLYLDHNHLIAGHLCYEPSAAWLVLNADVDCGLRRC